MNRLPTQPRDHDRSVQPSDHDQGGRPGACRSVARHNKRDPKYNFAVMDDIAVYPADKISTPVGKMSVEWLKTLEPSILNMQVPTYKHAM